MEREGGRVRWRGKEGECERKRWNGRETEGGHAKGITNGSITGIDVRAKYSKAMPIPCIVCNA